MTANMFAIRATNQHLLHILEPEHAEELFALADSNRSLLRRFLPWLDNCKTTSDTREFIQTALGQFVEGKSFNAGIWADQRLVGVIGHHRIDWSNRITTLGYWLTESYQGRGIMNAACRTVIAHAFDELQLNKVVIKCATDNVRSRAVPQRLGFVHEGTQRDAAWMYDHYIDLEVYGCLKRDWKHREPHPLPIGLPPAFR
jgi:ribosomal-protein-serine acetyltransferase